MEGCLSPFNVSPHLGRVAVGFAALLRGARDIGRRLMEERHPGAGKRYGLAGLAVRAAHDMIMWAEPYAVPTQRGIIMAEFLLQGSLVVVFVQPLMCCPKLQMASPELP